MAGYVTDEKLLWLDQNCFGNLYPALYEGFGLLVLEGMQFGAPTACANTTSLPEVAGDAGAKLDPIDERLWTDFMLRLEKEPDYRLRLIRSGSLQAGRFTLMKSASDCTTFYEKALTMEKRIQPVVVEKRADYNLCI